MNGQSENVLMDSLVFLSLSLSLLDFFFFFLQSEMEDKRLWSCQVTSATASGES